MSVSGEGTYTELSLLLLDTNTQDSRTSVTASISFVLFSSPETCLCFVFLKLFVMEDWKLPEIGRQAPQKEKN